MSAKAQFLQKLQARRPGLSSGVGRIQADIAEFTQRIETLKDAMEVWLDGTGIVIETTVETLSDLLVGSQPFTLPGILLRYEQQSIRFTPLFLYGHGVTGCMEASLHSQGKNSPLQRLFMRSDTHAGWVCIPQGAAGGRIAFDEDVFFNMLTALLR